MGLNEAWPLSFNLGQCVATDKAAFVFPFHAKSAPRFNRVVGAVLINAEVVSKIITPIRYDTASALPMPFGSVRLNDIGSRGV